jgi:hypothetical protein
MKIQATFWLNDEDETSIPMNMYDLSCPPFKVGDQIHIDIEDLHPRDYNTLKPERAKLFQENNSALKDLLRLKTIEVVKMNHYARFNTINSGTMTYEYHCKIVEETNDKRKKGETGT